MEGEKQPKQRKNPAVKRIMQEMKELQDNPSDDFISLPLEDDIFDWQFAIRGPPDTEFEGGIYHGRIQLPTDYPFQPPSFMLLTPNGRFETQTKICLSISNHHPEHWQPSWSVRTALTALIAFMPTDPGGAVGSRNFPKAERIALAKKSRESSPKFGTPERQRLVDEIHQYMLSKTPPAVQISPQPPSDASTSGEAEASQPNHQYNDNGGVEARVRAPATQDNNRVVEHVREVHWNAGAGPIRFGFSARLRTRRRVSGNPNEPSRQPLLRRLMVFNDRLLTYAAIALAVAIAVLLCKKLMKASAAG